MADDGKGGRRREAAAFVSAQQVAERAGVSRSAVSRAFTPGASIGKETREKVLRAARELDYQVNDLARGLLARRSRLVGLVTTRPEVGFRAHLTAALAKILIGRGNLPVLVNTGDTPEEMEAAQRMLIGYRAEATVVLSGSPPAPFLDAARRNGQPVILIGRSEPDVDSVLVDNGDAAAQAAARMAGQGARRLGVVGARSRTQSLVEREVAFVGAAGRLGLPVRCARGADADYAGGAQAAADLLAGEDRPDAVFCGNDLLAFGLIDHARSRLGLRIPGDLAVIGFDDIPEAGWEAYALTTFRQVPERMAAAAVALLDRRRGEPGAPPAINRLKAALVERRSG